MRSTPVLQPRGHWVETQRIPGSSLTLETIKAISHGTSSTQPKSMNFERHFACLGRFLTGSRYLAVVCLVMLPAVAPLHGADPTPPGDPPPGKAPVSKSEAIKAVRWLDWAFSLATPNLRKHSPQRDPLLAARSRVLIQQGKAAEALKPLRDRVTLLERADAGEGTRLAAALEDLAAALKRMPAPGEADSLLERARLLRSAPPKLKKG